MTIQDKLEKAIQTAKERGAVYGHNGHEIIGRSMAMLFPDGLVLKTGEDFARFLTFAMVMVKSGRYARNFAKGGHADSAHDAGVYAFILEDIDDHSNGQRQQSRTAIDGKLPARRKGRYPRRKNRRNVIMDHGRKKKH